MRFYFDIDDDDFQDLCGSEFNQLVIDKAVGSILSDYAISNNFNIKINELLKSKQEEICEVVIERVAEKIAKKKAIAAMTPSASKLAAADKDNIAYFEKMIDKAIVKKFGG